MKLKDGWYAKDSNQDVHWYGEKPEKRNGCWITTTSPPRLCIYDWLQIDGPWEYSLHKVKDGVITEVTTYEKDQKVLVSADGEHCDDRKWYRRYYSHYKDGKHFVFTNGKTSWSQEGKTSFLFIKPAEEEE